MNLPAGRIAVDSAIFIYFIEQHPKYHARVRSLFEAASAGERELVTSIQLATATMYGCVAFLTNDRRLPDAGLREHRH